MGQWKRKKIFSSLRCSIAQQSAVRRKYIRSHQIFDNRIPFIEIAISSRLNTVDHPRFQMRRINLVFNRYSNGYRNACSNYSLVSMLPKYRRQDYRNRQNRKRIYN